MIQHGVLSLFLSIIFALFLPMFVHLNCHSVYSFLMGASRIDDLVKTAAQMGMPALALTDTNGLYGAVAFYKSARQAGIVPIFGTEIESVKGQRAVLLAKNMEGFGEICRVLTNRYLQESFSFSESLRKCSHDVIILSSDQENLEDILKERGTKSLAVEISRLGGADDRVVDLIAYSRQRNLPLVATNRVFFTLKEDWKTHRLLSAIRVGSTIYALPKNTVVSRDAWLKPPSQMKKMFSGFK